MQTVIRFSLCLLAFTIAAFAAHAEDPAPGAYKKVSCKKAPDKTYDLYVPKAYATEPDRKFPILFISTPNARQTFYFLEKWADRNGVLLVCINDSKNGPWPEIQKCQDAVIDSVEQTLRVHPCLRFAMGMSGAASASLGMAMRFPDKTAGVLMMCHDGAGQVAAKHICMAFIYGGKDDTQPPAGIEAAIRAHQAKGCPVNKLLAPGRGHEDAETSEIEPMLDWMLGIARISHPKLSPEEQKAAKDEIVRRMKACAEIKAPDERIKEVQTLLDLPKVDTWPESKPLPALWLSAQLEAAKSLADPAAQCNVLMDALENSLTLKCSAAEQNAAKKELDDLCKQPACKKEVEAHETFKRAAQMETAAGKNKSKLAEAAQVYAGIAARYPDTKAGREASIAAKRMGEAK